MESSLRIDIIDWNNRFPLDRWYRKKYNIPYLSDVHRKSTFFNQLFEYIEDKVYEEHFKKVKKEKENPKVDTYQPMSDNWWIGKSATKEEVNDWFDQPIE